MITVRKGGVGDIAGVMTVMDSAFDPEFGEKWTERQCISSLSMSSTQLVVAQSGTDIVGFALCRSIYDETELLMIGVHPNWQRKSIAANIVNHIVDEERQSSRSKLFLEVREGNPAQLFYVTMGFLPIGRRKDYYRGTGQSKFDAITMALLLN